MIFFKTTLALILTISIAVLMLSGRYKTYMRLFMIFFYVILLIFIASPPLSDIVAHYFGIGTGKDMIIYLCIAIIWFMTAINHAKIRIIERHITELIRKDALDSYIET